MPSTSPRPAFPVQALVLLVFAGLAPVAAHAQAAPGIRDTTVRVRLQWTNDSKFYEDTRLLRGLAGDTLLLIPLSADDAGRVPFANMSRVDLRGGGHGNAGKGALILGLVGVVIGIELGSTDLATNASNSAAPVLTTVGFGAGFALIGAGIGSLIRSGAWRRATLADLGRALAEPRGTAPPNGAAAPAKP